MFMGYAKPDWRRFAQGQTLEPCRFRSAITTFPAKPRPFRSQLLNYLDSLADKAPRAHRIRSARPEPALRRAHRALYKPEAWSAFPPLLPPLPPPPLLRFPPPPPPPLRWTNALTYTNWLAEKTLANPYWASKKCTPNSNFHGFPSPATSHRRYLKISERGPVSNPSPFPTHSSTD